MRMADILSLLTMAQERLDEFDPLFNDKAATVLAILRSKGVVARTRLAQSNRWHQLLSAAFVVAFEEQHDIHITTRRHQVLHDAGISTKLTHWLDQCCEQELLVTQSQRKRAEGRLSLGELLHHYLSENVKGVADAC